MATTTSTALSRVSVEKQLWKACDELRGVIPADQALEVVLDVLLWARWIPASDGELVGYFDAMRSLATKEEWSSIQKAVAQRSGSPLASPSEASRLEPESLERLRSALLPVGRALNSGDRLQCKAVIEAISELKASNRSGGELACSASMGGFWEALLASHPDDAVACLFPVGVAASPFLGMDHELLLHSANHSQAHWVLGLLSLYPQGVKPQSIADQAKWPIAIAAPPWGGRTPDLLIDDPWLPPSPLDCPAAIRDSEARRVFAAHQRCSGTTYALVSAGIGFRTSRDLEFFREELVRKNWLDAVVALPAGVMGGTRIEGLLLVLKRDRRANAPIQMVAAKELLTPYKRKTARQNWESTGSKELAQLLNNRKEDSYSRLVTAEELEANGFSFQVSRYLHSEDDLVLQRYLDSRTTVQLGDLAEIRRPVASLGRQEDDGIEVREVAPNDVDDSGQLRQGSKRIRLPEAALAKGRQQLLEPGDVLMSIKGGLGKVAVVQDLEHPTVPGQAFCVVRLRPNAPLTPAALVQYLRSAVGQTLLDKAGQRPDVAFVPIGEVKSMPVVIPHPSELQRAEALEQESVALSREVEELSRKLQRLSRQGWMEDLPPDLLTSHQGEAA
jgi:type I restriction-modification system DNA methylase subunit